MKIHFKEQDFQIQAVQAVVDCFQGQPLAINRFAMEKSHDLIKKAKLAATGSTQTTVFDDELLQDIGYRNTPVQISESQVLKNIRAVQRNNDLHESDHIERPAGGAVGYNLTIEMETGTGKTYTYIRTMYELHKHYGWSKFIVIVPSIAIREGVNQSFADTQEHFQELYGHVIKPFIYNSARPQDIESFASDSRISVMIINTQAFAARGEDARRIKQELDQFGSRRPIDIIADTNPILVIDEPQSVDGPTALESMQEFNPLFALRYSATHKVDYNKIFRLDALDAYNRQLVKKIQVKGVSLRGATGTTGYLYLEQVSLSTTRPPFAIVEMECRTAEAVIKIRTNIHEGDNLHDLSNGLPAYKNQVVTEINGYLNKIVIGGQDIFPGDISNDNDEATFRRIQIRECIHSHLTKEQQLYDRGVKVLSLFFIDNVDKYRVYNETGDEASGEYAKMFEEEYNKVRGDFVNAATPYGQYLVRDDATAIHQGYFAVDKKNRMVDPALKRGNEDSDDISAYDLIMKGKDRLLNFDEPVRFIFSHSALKEGWDNPNVFQICALKHAEGGSQTRRRQEVGRGMRLCVNKDGDRLDFEILGEQVHDVNKLTVIASESYESFAKGLQKEIAAGLKDRPQKADADFFTGKLLRNANDEKHRITGEEAGKLNKFLYKHDILDDDDRITAIGKDLIGRSNIPLPEAFEPYREAITNLLKKIYSADGVQVEDERQTIALITNANFETPEFQNLWKLISQKSIYQLNIDTAVLIRESQILVNTNLVIGDRLYEVLVGELQEGSKEELKKGKLVKKMDSDVVETLKDLDISTVYDIIGEIATLTDLTRKTIVQILAEIDEEKFLLLRKNPEAFISKVAGFINEARAGNIRDNITYSKINAWHDVKDTFVNNKFVSRKALIVKKHIYDYLETDSDVERDFAQALEASAEVVVYAKLPRKLRISTPVGGYSPDWAIVFDKNKVRNPNGIVETKGSDSGLDMRAVEKLKLDCAPKHFQAISGNDIVFYSVDSFEGLMGKIAYV